jgi:hypothetical protein
LLHAASQCPSPSTWVRQPVAHNGAAWQSPPSRPQGALLHTLSHSPSESHELGQSGAQRGGEGGYDELPVPDDPEPLEEEEEEEEEEEGEEFGSPPFTTVQFSSMKFMKKL